MKKILMIAFHYPPFRGSSGIQRTLKFSRYLSDFGWQPIILTVNPNAYPQVGDAQLHDIPSQVAVKRVYAWDTARHLAVRGSYLRWMALPDRWVSWWPSAIAVGLCLIRKYQPEVIWSTYPIATAHLIGLTLHCLSRIPWVADFRDPMKDTDPSTGVEYPLDPAVRRVNGWIERLAVKNCSQAVFTTPGAVRMYADRYPEIPQSRWALIENGYDEEDFLEAERAISNRSAVPKAGIVFVHSGVLPLSTRDPRTFFAALAELRRTGKVSSSDLKIILRASGNEDYYQQCLREHGIDDIVLLEPPIPYRDALVEMLSADGLLIFQASNCNSQIPAKLYECLRARRPIFALTDPEGDTAAVLGSGGIDTIVLLDQKEQIAQGLLNFLDQVREECTPVANNQIIDTSSRKSRTRELARLLDLYVK